MYIFKNALVSIIRNKGRNFLIGIIVIVIASATAITLAIRNSATSLIESYESQYEVEATIGINRDSMRQEMQMDKEISDSDRKEQMENMTDIFSDASNISIEDIDNYGNSSYVKSYYYQVNVGVNSDDLEKASMSSQDGNNSGFGNMSPGRGGKENFQNLSSSDFTLIGYSSLNAMEEFISGKYTITDGNVFEDMESNSCVINSELALLNDIEVGDTIEFVDALEDSNTIILTVTGIYEEESDGEEGMGMFTSSANSIITNASIVNSLVNNNEEIQKTITPTFILTSKDVIDDFENELTEKGMSEYLAVSTNLEQVESATSTISNVNTFATTFLIITLVIGGIVLFIINMINIRERKYEIGVLRTIGMKKSLLTFQFIIELLLVSIVSLLIGAGIGAVTSVPVSNYLLESEISSATEEVNNINNNFGKKPDFDMENKISGTIEIQAFDSIDAVVDTKVLIQLMAIGILLTLVSSTASMISIQKFSPLTILKERS